MDPTWENTAAAVWSFIECKSYVHPASQIQTKPLGCNLETFLLTAKSKMLVSIGVLAACLPTLKPLFAIILPRVFRSTVSGQTNQCVDYGSRKGSTYGVISVWRKSRTGNLPPFKSSNAGVFAKEVDSDTAALRTDGSFASGGRDIEMAAYNVSFLSPVWGGGVPLVSHLSPLKGKNDIDSTILCQVTVTAGRLRRDSDLGSPSQVPRDLMGIQTTTVVTQRVDCLRSSC